MMPLRFTAIPHGLYASGATDLAVILPLKGAFMDRSLWVGVERVEDGEIITHVFNMGEKRVRLVKGDCISELVMLGNRESPEYGDPRPVDLRTFDSPV